MMIDDRRKLDPDSLLDRVRDETRRARRGRHKIFLGYAAGVGKTFAMLEAAHARKAEGIDVVAGYVEAHGRAETDSLLQGLEVLPPRLVAVGGATLRELDVDAVLKRRPALVLIDELAHTNAPRSRHEKRWQDVEEILDAGIDVYSTLNLQHVESLKDVVARVTGVSVRETLPDRVLDEATEVLIVDLPIVELLDRIRAGKIYAKAQADRALEGFFRESHLSALRELALRRTADRVDRQVRDLAESSAKEGPNVARERLLVCVGPSPFSKRLVRAACRLAQSLDAEWHAVFVDSDSAALSPSASERVGETLRLAESLGAKPRRVPGTDVVEAIVDYARRSHVTKIVVGKPESTRREPWFTQPLVDRIIRQSGEIDIVVIRDPHADEDGGRVARKAARSLDRAQAAIGLCGVAAATILGLSLREHLAPANLVMLYLLVVVITSLRFDRPAALLVALASVLAFDFFLVPPYLTFVVADWQYVVTFLGLLVVGFATTELRARLRAQTESAIRREGEAVALYECSRALAAATDRDAIVAVLVDHVRTVFAENVAIWLPGDGGLELHPASEPFPTQVFEGAVARWVYEHGKPAGSGTGTLSGVRSLLLPIGSGPTHGVLSLFRTDDTRDLTLDRRRLLESFAAQGASALERFRLAESSAQARLLEERERVRGALLDSVSHDLRTPLATITGSLSSLRDDESLLDADARRELIANAATEAERLNRLVGDLLDMTRLQAGSIELKLRPCDLQDLVGAALEQLGAEIGGRTIHIDVPATPLVALDFTLICQAMVNVLGNALRYSDPSTPIEVSARVNADLATIEIADRGIGIPESELKRVFEKFHRGSEASRRRGSGLGLSIAKAILVAHGGTIVARRRDGGGTIIAMSFPVRGGSEDRSGGGA